MSLVVILSFIESTRALWKDATKLAFNVRRAGLTVPAIDILIATSGMNTGATLLHADSHSDLMANQTNLRVEGLVDVIK